MDLGARPHQVFCLVTLPMIAQALVSAWLLTFTISLDDVVLSAFLSGRARPRCRSSSSRGRDSASIERQRARQRRDRGGRDRHAHRQLPDRARRA
jgi:hypothetical protein